MPWDCCAYHAATRSCHGLPPAALGAFGIASTDTLDLDDEAACSTGLASATPM